MGVPGWWSSRRFGLFVHANLATVPAWAPIGQYAEWYQSHLGEPVPDVVLHPTPMVEVLAHHRERWGHIERYDDFWPLLTFDHFDAGEWAALAAAAGMGYTVVVAKHHDGLCWWDAPNTERTVLRDGPRRDVLGEYAAACERAGLVFGTYYSLVDWADPRYPGDAYVDEVLHPHVVDLVERHGSRYLWGDGHWAHGAHRWRTADLIERVRRVAPDLVVNDRWRLAEADVVTYEYQTPATILDRPWELCRGIAHSFGHNRAERAEHHLTAGGIVALLTETVAKGGNLLLGVGPAADGSIPELQAAPLRGAGDWVRANQSLVDGSRPWRTWGDATTRYLDADGALYAIDVAPGAAVASFAALGRAAGRVHGVTSADGATIEWEQRDGSLDVVRRDRRPPGLAAAYRIAIEEPAARPATLFDPGEVAPVDLAALLAGARPGTVVQLGEGVHTGPVHVPAGVTLRGLGHDRTVVDGGGGTALTLGAGARVEHLSVSGCGTPTAWRALPAVRLAGDRSLLLGCHVAGHAVAEADDTTVRACHLAGVTAGGVHRVTVSRSHLTGGRWDVGVDLTDGSGHTVESCEITDHLCAVRLTGTVGAVVRGNAISARWWGVHLVGTDASSVTGNAVASTMRAVDVDGGTLATVSGNAVRDGDSGCIVEGGAAGVRVAGNRWERCRIGLLAWEAVAFDHHDNTAVDLHDPEHTATIGPP